MDIIDVAEFFREGYGECIDVLISAKLIWPLIHSEIPQIEKKRNLLEDLILHGVKENNFAGTIDYQRVLQINHLVYLLMKIVLRNLFLIHFIPKDNST